MRTAPAAEILLGWERSLDQPPWQRALTLLAIGYPSVTLSSLANLDIVERDARLMEMRGEMFGPGIEGLVDCPSCSQCVEFNLDSAALCGNRAGGDRTRTQAVEPVNHQTHHYSGHDDDHADGPRTQLGSSMSEDRVHARSVGTSNHMVVHHGDFVLHCRFPNSLDVAAISASADGQKSRHQLIERCLLKAELGERSLSAAELPDEAIKAVSDHLSQAEPAADPCFGLKCPRCGNEWQTAFDIVSFFWSELSAWAHRLLLEIHLLASVYGWSEDQILSLSPRRRRAYLDLIQA